MCERGTNRCIHSAVPGFRTASLQRRHAEAPSSADGRRLRMLYETVVTPPGVEWGDRSVSAPRNPRRFAAPGAPSGRRSLRRQPGVEPKRWKRSRHRMPGMPINPHAAAVDD